MLWEGGGPSPAVRDRKGTSGDVCGVEVRERGTITTEAGSGDSTKGG